jgi:hypothetical protein
MATPRRSSAASLAQSRRITVISLTSQIFT